MKLFLHEPGTDFMLALHDSLPDAVRCISALAPVEVSSAIHRKLRRNELTAVAAHEALEAVALDALAMHRVAVEHSLIRTATRLIAEAPLRAMDAMQLASALRVRDSAPDRTLTFVSADERLLKAAQQYDLAVLNPIHPSRAESGGFSG